MTALEYMEKQIQQHRISHIQAVDRNAPEEMLENIRRKIGYYEEAVEALRRKENEMKARTCAEYIQVDDRKFYLAYPDCPIRLVFEDNEYVGWYYAGERDCE